MPSRKDYIGIAWWVKQDNAPPPPEHDPQCHWRTGYWTAVEAMATYLVGENPRFQRTKFLSACGHPYPHSSITKHPYEMVRERPQRTGRRIRKQEHTL